MELVEEEVVAVVCVCVCARVCVEPFKRKDIKAIG
jgi:hypothetical protein